MEVSQLKKFILSLESPIRDSGGAKVADDLARVVVALSAFDTMSVKDFSDFLVQAEEYHRTGLLPISKTGKGGRAAKAPGLKGEALIKDIAAQIERICDSAADHSQSHEELEKQIQGLLKKPTKNDVVAIARELHLPGSFKTKGDAINAVVSLAVDRRFTFGRTQF